MTHYTMCGAAQGDNTCFVPWCTCPCHCQHASLSGDEGPVAELGRMPKRWRCDECGTIVHDNVLPTEGNQHEFVSSGSDEKRCRHCGGYPFDLEHWTI